MLKTTSVLLGLCVLCVHTALPQGTFETRWRWRLTLSGAETQCSFSIPYSYLTDPAVTWDVTQVQDFHVVDPIDGNSNYQLDFTSGVVFPPAFWDFYVGVSDFNIGRMMIIGGGPTYASVDISLWGVQQHIYYSGSGQWQVQAYDVPEPSPAALAMLGVVTWCLRRKLGGSAANRASVVKR
jgi:hypothetical protein